MSAQPPNVAATEAAVISSFILGALEAGFLANFLVSIVQVTLHIFPVVQILAVIVAVLTFLPVLVFGFVLMLAS